jgi:hypothetical protein
MQTVERDRNRVKVVVEQVGISVQGDLRARVPEHPLESENIDSRADGQAGTGVS